jgi:hypothetical protein
LKVEASTDAARFKAAQEFAAVGETPSFDDAVKGMQIALTARSIEVCQSTCWTYMQKAIDNNNLGISLQKP